MRLPDHINAATCSTVLFIAKIQRILPAIVEAPAFDQRQGGRQHRRSPVQSRIHHLLRITPHLLTLFEPLHIFGMIAPRPLAGIRKLRPQQSPADIRIERRKADAQLLRDFRRAHVPGDFVFGFSLLTTLAYPHIDC